MPSEPLFKIATREQWARTRETGVFPGAPVDHADGYVHLSTAGQVRETAARHFAGQMDLVLLWVAPDRLDEAIRFEPSRGGDLFPHLYGELPLAAIERADPLSVDFSGVHVWPDDLPGAGEAT